MIFTAIVLSFLLVSCAKEYDISKENIDTTINIGGENLAFPLGETDTVYITDYMDVGDIDKLKVDEKGNYYLEFFQNVSEQTVLKDLFKDFYIPNATEEKTYKFLPKFQGTTFSIPKDINYTVHYNLDEVYERGVKDIDSIIFKNVEILVNAHLDLVGLRKINHDVDVKYDLTYPAKYHVVSDGKPLGGRISGENRIVCMSALVDRNGNVDFPEMKVTSVVFEDFSEYDLDFKDVFRLDNVVCCISPSDIDCIDQSSPAEFRYEVFMGTRDEDRFLPDRIYGLFDYESDPLQLSVEMDEIPDFIKADEVIADFYNPYIKLIAETNSTIPFSQDLSVDYEINDFKSKPLEVSLDIPYTDDPSVDASGKYWLSARDRVPLEEGYEWIPVDIPSIFKRIPDRLNLSVKVKSDIEKSGHLIDLNAVYNVNEDLHCIIPLSFGSKLNLPVTSTIENIPPALTRIIEQTDFVLGGTIVSMFPVNVRVNFIFQDAAGNDLDINVAPQTVESITQEGVPVETPLYIDISRTDLPSQIDKIVVELTLLPGRKPGIPLSQDAFLKAELNARVPGGVNVDLDDLKNDDETNN